MQLMMYIGNDLIEAVPVDANKIAVPGYLGSFKRQLKQKYQVLLQEIPQHPEFLVINLTPASVTTVTSTNYTTTATTAGVYCP
jgi:hypothetical protein